MSKKGQKKKRPSEYLTPSADPSANVAQTDRCVYCGKALDPQAPPCLVTVRTRSFPVCGQACREGADAYVRSDRQRKKFLYLVLFFCAIAILIGSVIHDPSAFLYPAVCLAGLGLIFFPYPITSFETFFSCPIRRVVLICRIVGVILVILGVFFFAALRIFS
ncbi:MAG: hypothetical protein LKJ80_04600 [Oscillibacter sp.]|jgi:hypothetical protein|nr:hypothetical protein [Oscillibacter sp.]